ncbi:MAG: SDR family oxidoreductase [Chloroflexi bacterium]|nr:SDR family oxidoreductase [Chloroflexota bacterium]
MKALVTGGAGFIGSHLVERLVREGMEVRVLDNFSTGNRENLAAIASQIELIEGDICDDEATRQAMRGVEVVFHEAALCSVARSVENPQKSNDMNVGGTLNVLVAARDEGVRRLVYASSSSVYGNIPALPKKEAQAPAPASPYAVTKLAGELYCRVFYQIFGLETFALRYFNVFGPRQVQDSAYAAVIPRFTSALLRGEPPVIFGDGEQSRDFSYVDNVVEANLLAVKAKAGFGEAFNVACGRHTTVSDVAAQIACLMGMSVKPVHREPRPGDVRHSLADINKAASVLGYQPRIEFSAGLERTVRWYQECGVRV